MRKVKDYNKNNTQHQLSDLPPNNPTHHYHKSPKASIKSPMHNIAGTVSSDFTTILDPLEISRKAFKKVKQFGSATLSMCTLDDSN